jgi:hypothetical protein
LLLFLEKRLDCRENTEWCPAMPFFIVGVNGFHCRREFSVYRGNHRKNCLSFLDFSFSAFTARNRIRVRFSDKNVLERCKTLIGCLGVPFFIVGVNRFHCRRGFSNYRGNYRKNCLSFLDFLLVHPRR